MVERESDNGTSPEMTVAFDILMRDKHLSLPNNPDEALTLYGQLLDSVRQHTNYVA